MSFKFTVKVMTVVAAILGFLLTMKWSLWLMSQSSDAAFLAGPCFIVLATSALLRIFRITFTTKEIH